MEPPDPLKALAVQPAAAIVNSATTVEEERPVRRVRCDRESPCAPCKAANLSCRTETSRSKTHTRRVQVSKQYEDKIDSIDVGVLNISQRLANIELLLRQSNSSITSPQTPSSTTLHTPQAPADNAAIAANLSASEDNSSTDKPVAGYNDANVEFTAATFFLEQAISWDAALQNDGELNAAVRSLRGVIDRNEHGVEISDKGITENPLPTAIDPQWEQVKAVLQRAEGNKPMMFNFFSDPMFNNFRQKCHSMYERGIDGSPCDKLLVYSGLSNVCAEFTAENDPLSASYNHGLQRAFAWLLLKALANFPLIVPASVETLEALLLASMTMISMCKPSLAWSLICKAAQICQKLGFNRLTSSTAYHGPQHNRKVLLFWAIYAIDRNISFRLGQTPVIQDCDISTPLTLRNDERHSTARELMTFWVDCGRVQGKICTQLYTPTAFTLSEADRARVAQDLADDLERIYQRKREANAVMAAALGHSDDEFHTDAWIHSDGIDFYSTLATTLYAIPPSQPGHAHALEAARQCLRLSRDLSNRYFHNVYNWTTCCHWVLLKGPLISCFTGVLYNAIANASSSRDDIQLLEDFVISMQAARHFSDPIEKFYQLCLAFVRVAKEFVRVKTKQQSYEDSDLFSASQAPKPDSEIKSRPGEAFGQGAAPASHQQDMQQTLDPSQTFQDWYAGNASLYGLLEQDFDYDLFVES